MVETEKQQPVEVHKLKQELAEKYIKDFQKELNFLEKGMVKLSEKKLKEMLLQEEALGEKVADLKFSKLEQLLVSVLESLAPKTVDKIFEFLKEKQKLLLRASTREELENLKNNIDPNAKKPEDGSSDNDKNSDGSNKDEDSTDKEKKNPDKESTDRVHPLGGRNPYIDAGIIAGGAGAEITQKGIREGVKRTEIEGKLGEKGKQLGEALKDSDVKKGFQEVIHMLETRLANPQLLAAQKKGIENTLKIFKNAENANATAELKMWKKLLNKGKLQGNLFGKMNPSEVESLAKSMKNVVNDEKLMEAIASAKDEKAVALLLEQKGITDIPKDALKVLSNAKDIEVVKGVTSIFAKGDKVFALAKATRAIPFLDLAIMGVEIVHFDESLDEADALANKERGAVMRERAYAHLATNVIGIGVPATIATGAAIYTLCTGLACAGPAGWVVLSGVAATEALNYGMDKLIFDVKDFYAKDKDDFIGQYRTEIKQAIVQAAAGSSWDNLSINEKTCEFFGQIHKERKMKTLNDALWAMIYLEEVKKTTNGSQDAVAGSRDFSTVAQMDMLRANYNNLPQAQKDAYDEMKGDSAKQQKYDEQKKQLEAIIETRMNYLAPYLPGGEKANEFTKNIKSAEGIHFVEQIVADSDVYAEMEAQGATRMSVVEYEKQSGEDLQKQNEVLFKKMNDLYATNPLKAVEFIQNIELFKNSLENNTDYAEKYALLKPTIDYLLVFSHWKQLGVPYENKSVMLSLADMNYVAMEKSIESLSQGGDITFNGAEISVNDLKTVLINKGDQARHNEIEQYTNNIGQNILFRIAKEFHGYEGANDMSSLQNFFNTARDSALGIYFDQEKQQWFINNDNDIDQVMNLHDLEKYAPEQIMTQWFKEVPTWQRLLAAGFGPVGMGINASSLLPKTSTKDMIDTPTETTDDYLNKELFAKMYKIISQEKQALAPESKEQTTKALQEYIALNAKNGYVKLPYYLLNSIARAGLGNLQYWYFHMDEKNTIHACTTNEYVSSPLPIKGVIKEYIDMPADGSSVDISTLEIHTLSENAQASNAIDTIDTMVSDIQHTCGEITWHGRGNVLYDPSTKEIKSWGEKIRCENVDGKRKVGDLGIVYDDMKEALWTANLVNRFKEYKKKHIDAEFGRGYMAVAGGLYNRSTMPDTQVIDPETAEDTFKHTFDSTEHRNAFIEYIEKKL